MLKAASVFSNYALTAVVFQFKLFTCPVYAFSTILDQANNILLYFFLQIYVVLNNPLL